MEQPTRATVYLETRQRLDGPLAERNTRKTKGKLKCIPPNKPCGGRCIPQNWNCRITGGGLDSHSKAVQFDPVGGVNNVVRGVGNVKKGVVKGDPELITRGLKGVERGITKLTPGKDLEQKHRIRQRVKNAIAFTAVSTLAYVGGRKIHNTLKSSSESYRKGWGKQIDEAALRSRNRVLDTLDRIPIIGGSRERARQSALGAARQLGIGRAVVERTRANQAPENARSANILANRTMLRSSVPGIADVQAVDKKARELNFTFDQWQGSKATALLSMSRKGEGPGSAYSKPAAHELLAARFGLKLPHRSVRAQDIAGEESVVKAEIKTRVAEINKTLVAGMEARGLNIKSATDRNRYLSELVEASPINIKGADRKTLGTLRRAHREDLSKLLGASSTERQSSYASNLYASTVSMYDGYFARSTQNLSRPPAAKESTFGDAFTGITRLHAAEGRAVRPVNRDHALFQNQLYFHSNVKQNKEPYTITSDRAIRIARTLQGGSTSLTSAQAEEYLVAQGYKIRVGTPRSASRTAPTPAAPSPAPKRAPKSAPTRLPQPGNINSTKPSRAERIQRLIEEGYKRSTAEQLVNNLSVTNPDLFDSASPRVDTYFETRARLDLKNTTAKGQPCGKSFIPKTYKCKQNTSQQPKVESSTTNVAANKHDAGYRVRQLSSVVARVGLTGGMSALAYHTFKNAKDDVDIKNALIYSAIAAVAVGSLIRETRTTKNTKSLTESFSGLKGLPGVENQTIDKLNKFISETEMDSQRVGAVQVLSGLGGYFDSSQPDRVHVVAGSMKLKGAVNNSNYAKAYHDGAGLFMETRAKLPPNKINADSMKTMGEMRTHFTGAGYIGNSQGQQQYLLSHEIGHALHYRSNFASPQSVKVGSKTYTGPELTRELRKSTSIYGQSDLQRHSEARFNKDNYYMQGGRLETFSENFALYVGNGKKMKELYPVSYAWTKATADYAFAQPAKKLPRPFIDVVKDLASKGRPDVLPPATSRGKKARTDADDADRFFALYEEMVTAANEGDVMKATLVLAKAQALPQEQRFMIASLMETAAMYAQEDKVQ